MSRGAHNTYMYNRFEDPPINNLNLKKNNNNGKKNSKVGMQNPQTTAEPAHAERNPENPEEQGEEGEGTSQGDNLMMRKMRMVRPLYLPACAQTRPQV